MYSQRDEEPFILEYFKNRSGYVLDIGAYDGKTFSNTLALIERGWGGTLVEASPGPFRSMMQLFKDRRDLNLVLGCINQTRKLMKFYASDDAVGTDDQDHYEKWKQHGGFHQVHISTITIDDILEVYAGPYDFVNIDIEGEMTEWVFRNLPYDKMQTKLVCVEHNGGNGVQRFADIGVALGMRVLKTTGENHILEVIR